MLHHASMSFGKGLERGADDRPVNCHSQKQQPTAAAARPDLTIGLPLKTHARLGRERGSLVPD